MECGAAKGLLPWPHRRLFPLEVAVSRVGVFFVLQMLAVASSFAAKPTASEVERTRGEVAKLVRELDSDRFDVRDKAAARLQELVGESELRQCLAEEYRAGIGPGGRFLRGPLAT